MGIGEATCLALSGGGTRSPIPVGKWLCIDLLFAAMNVSDTSRSTDSGLCRISYYAVTFRKKEPMQEGMTKLHLQRGSEVVSEILVRAQWGLAHVWLQADEVGLHGLMADQAESRAKLLAQIDQVQF